MLGELAKAATNIKNQGTEILSGKPKDLTKTSSTSNQGDQYRHDIAKQYQDMLAGGYNKYQGPNPYTSPQTTFQQAQATTLGGLQNRYGGTDGIWDQGANVAKEVAGYDPTQINVASRSGGPGAGYMNPYEQQVIGGLKKDFDDAMKIGRHNIGAGATGANAFGGTRHGVAESQMGTNLASNFLNQTGNLRRAGFSDAMGWKGQDLDRDQGIQAQNVANKLRGLGLNLTGASQMGNINPQLNLASAQGGVGQYDQGMDIAGRNWLQQNWQNEQNWKPNLLRQYGNFANSGQWGGSQTAKGQGKSDLMNLVGMGVGLAGAGLSGGQSLGGMFGG